VSANRRPELSVVVVTDCFRTIRKVVEHLRAQTVVDRLELVLVAPSEQALALDRPAVDGFAATRVVEAGSIVPLGPARAAGIRASAAELVALVETHVFTDPRWAEALIAAHRQPWAAVGAAFGNANPRTAVSWSNLLLDYGSWTGPRTTGVVPQLPSNNSCYRRELLLELGPLLEEGMGFGPPMHAELRARGHRLLLAADAKVVHLNVDLLGAWIVERFLHGRVVAGKRASRWSARRRTVYALGSPLIPAVRAWRIWRYSGGAVREHRLLPRVLPPLAVGLIVSTLGEIVGFAFGEGDAEAEIAKYEISKAAFVREPSRSAVA
jgi:hypothetical protein